MFRVITKCTVYKVSDISFLAVPRIFDARVSHIPSIRTNRSTYIIQLGYDGREACENDARKGKQWNEVENQI